MKKKQKIIVLGAGLVGGVIAADLNRRFNVTSADIDQDVLLKVEKEGVDVIITDLSDPENIRKIVQPFDLVVGAMPGYMGFQTVKAVIEAGKNIVDISFFPEDPFQLHQLANEKNVTAIVDCGVAPGMGNIILGYHDASMKVSSYQCYVGGLPFKRKWPFEYKAVFSPVDVIEEYTRPARFVLHGQVVTREALSDPELIYFDEIGTLEAWNSDGLRTLIDTMDIPDMIEKTLRYPGTINYLRMLRECGFFSDEPVEIAGNKIKPLDLTAKLLKDIWKLKPGEEDYTIMRITISGIKEDKKKELVYDLYDRYDIQNQTISMARTTGFTCAAAANLVLEGLYTAPGISPPEYVGRIPDCFEFIMKYLANRGVNYNLSVIE
ncbi:MAG TPA: saccharopine dehydrogenase C-terminal domain-containing protein [Bacteroidales bacterium]|nr:saccharopine dehydrogenase C-terminal domain-containing protein [Bacteroidales bacterium]